MDQSQREELKRQISREVAIEVQEIKSGFATIVIEIQSGRAAFVKVEHRRKCLPMDAEPEAA